jgi:hypothetical protein
MIGAAVGAALVLTVQNLAAVVNLPSIILGSSSNNNNSPSAGVNDIKNKRAGVQFLTTSIDETINLHSTNNNNPQGTTFTAFPNWPAVRYHTLRSSTMTSTNNEKKKRQRGEIPTCQTCPIWTFIHYQSIFTQDDIYTRIRSGIQTSTRERQCLWYTIHTRLCIMANGKTTST